MCPQAWDWKYNHKLDPLGEGASLPFGGAVDTAVMAMLDGKTDFIKIFNERFYAYFRSGKYVQVFDNMDIKYGNKDFDEDVLQQEDKDNITKWLAELKLPGSDGVNAFKEISKRKSNPYKNISNVELRLFNRTSWLSLKRKGEILIKSFHEQFYPKITKVIKTQDYGKITDSATNDYINGYIDMILEIEGYDKPIIFDLKTAARSYSPEQLELSEQLTSYVAMKGEEYGTNLVGYVVLVKNIPKETKHTCKKCGFVKEAGTRFKTCPQEEILEAEEGSNKVKTERCKGEWEEHTVLKPVVQVMVQEKTQDQIDNLLLSYGNIIYAMKEKIVYRDVSKCYNWFGSKCAYFDACHKGDLSALKKRGK